MAGMKRFVTYIYSYEEGKKGSNIGFAKIEIRGEDCRIEIHLRGVYATRAACSVYLFRINDGRIEGVPVGEMRLIGGKGDFGVIVKAGHLADTPLGIGDMEGIVLLGGDGQIFLSRWKEGAPFAVSQDNFVEWQRQASVEEMTVPVPDAVTAPGERPPSPEPDKATASGGLSPSPIPDKRTISGEPQSGSRADEVTAPDEPQSDSGADGVTATRESQPNSEAGGITTPNEARPEPENVQATEMPVRNIFPAYDWREVWEKLQHEHPIFMPFADRRATCIQIELKDIRELPRRYWYLGNNSFLLHGFFNYRYLLVGKTGEDRWFLGVPGIYQRQERVMAAIFGFPEFLPAAGSGESDAGAEPVNRFGCWYRYIEE